MYCLFLYVPKPIRENPADAKKIIPKPKKKLYAHTHSLELYHLRNENQLESDGSRSGSSLSLRNIVGPVGSGIGSAITPGGTSSNTQSPHHHHPSQNQHHPHNLHPPHRGVHRSISATNSTKPSRRASSGGESLRESVASHAAGARVYSLSLSLSFFTSQTKNLSFLLFLSQFSLSFFFYLPIFVFNNSKILRRPHFVYTLFFPHHLIIFLILP